MPSKKPTDLELDPEEMRRMGEAAVRAVVEHIRTLPQAPRSNLEDHARITDALREPPPESGTDFHELLRFLMEDVIPVSINSAHPTYMAYIPGGGVFPSAVADFIGSAVNRFVGAWWASPAAARLEANALEWFAGWMGYPASSRGILTSGGSLANFSAVVTARKHLLGEDIGRGVLYASDQVHHCVPKTAVLAGIPERNIRLLPSDACYRAVPDLFEGAVRRDKERGLKPFLIVGNAGTTNTGAVDPLGELSEVARRCGLWYHVDGAYGGFFNLVEEGRRKLRGLESSDSLVLDPHKSLFVPYGSGSLLVKEGALLRKAHCLTADYLQDHVASAGDWSAADYSPELTRSFRGLRVWLPLKLYGVQAIRENLEEKLRLAKRLHGWLAEEPGCECLVEPELTAFAFRYRPDKGDADAFNRRLLAKINAGRRLYLSSTVLGGRFVIRICVLSFRTHDDEIRSAFEVIRGAAAELKKDGA
jgi:aromatic-L-amino-acid decarboxylase